MFFPYQNILNAQHLVNYTCMTIHFKFKKKPFLSQTNKGNNSLNHSSYLDKKWVWDSKESNGSQNKLQLAHDDCGEFPGSVILSGYQAAAARDWIASPKCGSRFISFPHQQNKMKWGILEMTWNIIADIAIIWNWSGYYTEDLAV